MTTEFSYARLLEELSTACPHGHAPADAGNWLAEMVVAEKINAIYGSDYEPHPNCRKKGIDLVSKSGKWPPIQLKHAKDKEQGGKTKRSKIISKALEEAKVEGFDRALLGTYQIRNGKLNKLVLGDVKQLGGGVKSELSTQGYSWIQLREWGFTEVRCAN
jgi:hypothetical protein